MRKHLFLGRGRYVHKQHIQHAMHSLAPASHRGISHSSIRKPSAPMGHGIHSSKHMKKISPLKFRF